ncbi:AAA family ATPase [Pseudomonas alliivorans]|nr:AAA family ATPase [Pseudomonas alliivorans]
MEVSVKNFATLSEANVHIGGLTVITGENDTGKSTIGKVLFSLVKAVARYEEDLSVAKETRVIDEAEKVYFSIRRTINVANNLELRDLFHPKKLYLQLKVDKYKAYSERLEAINALDLDPEIIDSYVLSLQKILAIMDEPEDKESIIRHAISKSFFSEFKDEIISKGSRSPKHASLNITDGASDLLGISWNSNGSGIKDFIYTDDLGYDDATYIDSPSIMQFHNLVKMAKTLFEKDPSRLTVPLHMKDLANKLGDSKYGFSVMSELFQESDECLSVASEINKLFNGVVSYDDTTSDFVLVRNGYSVSSSNMASGIRALGVLEMLITGGSVTPNTLLILDEPEINLHPRWQVDYSEIICKLVASGVDVIVNTHSPYVVEALNYYSQKTGIDNKFYLASRDSTYQSKIEDITGQVDIIIKSLSDPLIKLNEKLVDDFFE